jgi:hypothetical protein
MPGSYGARAAVVDGQAANLKCFSFGSSGSASRRWATCSPPRLRSAKPGLSAVIDPIVTDFNLLALHTDNHGARLVVVRSCAAVVQPRNKKNLPNRDWGLREACEASQGSCRQSCSSTQATAHSKPARSRDREQSVAFRGGTLARRPRCARKFNRFNRLKHPKLFVGSIISHAPSSLASKPHDTKETKNDRPRHHPCVVERFDRNTD